MDKFSLKIIRNFYKDLDIAYNFQVELNSEIILNKIVKNGGMRIKHIILKDKTRKYQIIFKSVLMDISIIKKLKHKNLNNNNPGLKKN